MALRSRALLEQFTSQLHDANVLHRLAALEARIEELENAVDFEKATNDWIADTPLTEVPDLRPKRMAKARGGRGIRKAGRKKKPDPAYDDASSRAFTDRLKRDIPLTGADTPLAAE